VARSENPIPDDSGALGELARRLRHYRDRTGMNYRQLAEQTHFSYSQLSRAASGKEQPTWDVTEAYLRGCGITKFRSIELLHRLWNYATGSRRSFHRPRWSSIPLSQVRTRGEFAMQLRALAYKEQGWIGVRDLALITEQSKTSVADWISGKTMPQEAALDQFASLLGASAEELADLHDARSRVLADAPPAAYAGLELLDALEGTVDEETFLSTLLSMVDSIVNVEHPTNEVVDAAEQRFVRRRAAGTPTWEASDAERFDGVLHRFPNHPATFAPKRAVQGTTITG
jgi:transcriptional regulator with XRE-family HTH domain